MRKVIFSIAVLLIICFANANSQMFVKTNEGEKLYGIKISENDSSITLLSEEFKEIQIKKNTIVSTELKNCTIKINKGIEFYGKFMEYIPPKAKFIIVGGAEIEINTKDIKKIKIDGTKTSKFGVTLGLHSGLNFWVGNDINEKFSFSFQGGCFFNFYSAQISGVYNFKKNIHFENGIGLGVGLVDIKDGKVMFFDEETDETKWNYVNLFYEMNYYGIYVNAGISVGKGDYKSPKSLFQIGYVYRSKK